MNRKKKKKQKKSQYPHFLSFTSSKLISNDAIITDAGFDLIDYELALKYFSFDDIYSWWESLIDFSELEDDEIDAWERISQNNFYPHPHPNQETIKEIINQCKFLPEQVEIATARAVFSPEYQWVKIITIIEKYLGGMYIDSYEIEAIKLGLKMKQELGDESLLIINDNQYAVANVSGYPFYLWEWENDLKDNESYIVWAPRKTVTIADRLTVKEATKIFSPDDDFDIFDDD